MKKITCDICEAPVKKLNDRNFHSLIEIEKPIKRFLGAKVGFVFVCEPVESNTEPDLCVKCMAKLVKDIYIKLRKVEDGR